jgi:hypothetical protein
MRITPARVPLLWGGCDAQMVDGVDDASGWDDVAQVAPDFEADQRVSARQLVRECNSGLANVAGQGKAASDTATKCANRKITGDWP